MSSAHAALADPAALSDWNRRVRRLARDYAPKYRPIVFSLGYHVNLVEGLNRTFIRVETIVKESARYTASGKPLQARYVKRLLAELVTAGAVKAEDRWSDDTGHRQSSYRTLDTSVVVDRRGFTRKHDFRATFGESSQVEEKKDTIQDTIQDTRTSFELDFDVDKNVSIITGPDDGHGLTSFESQNPSQSQMPARDDDWDETWLCSREWLAGHLGVSPGRVGWNAVTLADDLAREYGEDAVAAAAQRSQYQAGVSPVGYFVRSARSLCDGFGDDQQKREAAESHAARQRELSAEVESYRARFEVMGNLGRLYFRNVKDWRDAEKTDEYILARLPGLLERCTAQHAEKLAEQEREQVLIDYARRVFHGARRDARGHADRESGDQDVYDYMRDRLAALPPQDPGTDDTPMGDTPAEQRAWLESLRSGHR